VLAIVFYHPGNKTFHKARAVFSKFRRQSRFHPNAAKALAAAAGSRSANAQVSHTIGDIWNRETVVAELNRSIDARGGYRLSNSVRPHARRFRLHIVRLNSQHTIQHRFFVSIPVKVVKTRKVCPSKRMLRGSSSTARSNRVWTLPSAPTAFDVTLQLEQASVIGQRLASQFPVQPEHA